MVTIKDIRAAVYKDSDKEKGIVKKISEIPGIKTFLYTDEKDLQGIIKTLQLEGFGSKEVIIFREFLGRIFQSCPGSRDVICCNYYLLNISFDCLYNCAYCFLNSYLNSFGIIQFVNIIEALDEINFREISSERSMMMRIGTGEYTDSLMMDEITGISGRLINRIAPYRNIFLEFKTKSSNVDHLLDISEKGNTVISWSLNTEGFIRQYEEGTAGLDERIEASVKAAGAGFLTGFHFDPIILGNADFQEYLEVVERVLSRTDTDKIAWISMGCFRYSPDFKSIISEKFPGEKLSLGELFPGIDGKYRYLKKRRVEAYRQIKEKIESFTHKPFIYLCMETADVWDEVFGWRPESSDSLEEAFSRHLIEGFSL